MSKSARIYKQDVVQQLGANGNNIPYIKYLPQNVDKLHQLLLDQTGSDPNMMISNVSFILMIIELYYINNTKDTCFKAYRDQVKTAFFNVKGVNESISEMNTHLKNLIEVCVKFYNQPEVKQSENKGDALNRNCERMNPILKEILNTTHAILQTITTQDSYFYADGCKSIISIIVILYNLTKYNKFKSIPMTTAVNESCKSLTNNILHKSEITKDIYGIITAFYKNEYTYLPKIVYTISVPSNEPLEAAHNNTIKKYQDMCSILQQDKNECDDAINILRNVFVEINYDNNTKNIINTV